MSGSLVCTTPDFRPTAGDQQTHSCESGVLALHIKILRFVNTILALAGYDNHSTKLYQ